MRLWAVVLLLASTGVRAQMVAVEAARPATLLPAQIAAPAQAALAPSPVALGLSLADAPKGNVLPPLTVGDRVKALVGLKAIRLPRLENPSMSPSELAEAADFTVERRRASLKEAGVYTPVQKEMMGEVRRVQSAMVRSAAALQAKSGGAAAEVVGGREDYLTPRSYYSGLGDSAIHEGLRFAPTRSPKTLADRLANFAAKRGYGLFYDPAQTNFNGIQGFIHARRSEAVFNTRITLDLIRGVLSAIVLHELEHLRSNARVKSGEARAFDGIQIDNMSGRDPNTGHSRIPLPGADEIMNTRPYGAGFGADEVLARSAEVRFHRARLRRAGASDASDSDLRTAQDEARAMARMTAAAIGGAFASDAGRDYGDRVEYEVSAPTGARFRIRVALPPVEARPEGYDGRADARRRLELTLTAAAALNP